MTLPCLTPPTVEQVTTPKELRPELDREGDGKKALKRSGVRVRWSSRIPN
jgi:hypothetical protein